MTEALTTAGLVVATLVAASVGASLRHLLGQGLNGAFPNGTLLVNVVASFLVGMAVHLDGPWSTVVAIGGLGALSTWSTVGNEVATLSRAGEGGAAILYLAATITTGILAAWLGLQTTVLW